ncbi:MAG: hypothetical protein JWQ81_1604 [Amycolatopsis sp.]|uniref:hypothetical protein n=1 Tax=Amycolatopsis sp. TaxID=37632 RepID=UPI0026072A72|nr:hypothetical protein [Amycolatopsis sp.]MCU1680865.1 hypothetical protein [Amycolatopsis sp.]
MKSVRAVAGALAVVLVGTFSLIAAQPASAASQQGIGRSVSPGQPYSGRARSGDWLGSYVVGGQQVFCVSFELKAPDTDQKYHVGEVLLTKWGDALPSDIAANISYLLLRYGGTTDPDEAAALAHLLHSWTAAPRDGHDDLNPSKNSSEIGYDAPTHLSELPAAARQDVDKLTKDAEANRGPWTTSITPPTADQTIGTTSEWKISVKNANGKGMSGIPVTLKATEATLDGSKNTVTTGADGTATAMLTPTDAKPALGSTVSAPADKPYVRIPDVAADNTQHVVSTGGEKQLTAQGTAKASTKPGKVSVTKTDAKTGKGISGVALRITGKDKAAAAAGQDGKPLVGADGKPAVVTTAGDSGTVTVDNLRTPQDICVVEVSPAPGYGNAFDPGNPPSACGTIKPGETLALELKNAPNSVPHAIAAGGPPVIQARGDVVSNPSAGGLAGLAALALLGSGLVGLVARVRFGKR